MKKVLAITLLFSIVLALCGCGNDVAPVNVELIRKYDTGEKYYINVYNDIQIESFGARFSMPIYDVIETEDGYIQIYYLFDGKEAIKDGEEFRLKYIKYLGETFGKNAEQTRLTSVLSYDLAPGMYIKVMAFDMTSRNGKLIVVQYPSANAVLRSDTADSSEG